MRIVRFAVACCVLIVMSFGTIQSAPFGTQEVAEISVDTALVNVAFTVFDKNGHFITDLKQNQFRVFEDNRPQLVTHFSREIDLPLTVAVLADTSGSVHDELPFEQEAATAFFQAILRRGKDKGVILTFDTNVELLQDYTDDSEKIAHALQQMRTGGGTSIYDAVFTASTKKLANREGRRAIILITDGEDTFSRHSLAEALEAAQRNEIGIYAISTNRTTSTYSREKSQGDKVLKKLCDETGGRLFTPQKFQDLSGNFQTIANELRSQYSIAYRPSNFQRDGTFRKIRIEVADKRYTPRYRPGYFAPQPARP